MCEAVRVSEPLPAFRYHPDPVATGSIEAHLFACLHCGAQLAYSDTT